MSTPPFYPRRQFVTTREMDIADFTVLLQREYALEEDAATELARFGDAMIRGVLAGAGEVSAQLKAEMDGEHVITSKHVRRALYPSFMSAFKYTGPWKIPVCGDGNCCPTACRTTLDKEVRIKPPQRASRTHTHKQALIPILRFAQVAVERALAMLESGEEPKEDEPGPNLCAQERSANWAEGFDIRSWCNRFYKTENLHREMPPQFGSVSYPVKEADGTTKLLSRPMTRLDFLVLETQHSSKKDVDMGPDEAAVNQRTAIGTRYRDSTEQGGVWCSTPLLVAFVHMRKRNRAMRIYTQQGGKLIIYQDIVPEGADPLPSAEEDDILQDGSTESAPVEADLDDAAEYVPRDEDDDADTEEEESAADDAEMDEDTEAPKKPSYNFSRLLYTLPGHYDVLVSNHERNLLRRFWKRVENDMVPLFT